MMDLQIPKANQDNMPNRDRGTMDAQLAKANKKLHRFAKGKK
jgi:hypothetical protein